MEKRKGMLNMVNYQKTKSPSICEFLPFSLGMAVKLIWEGRFKGDFEEAANCLKKAFTQNVTTGVEGKAVELVSRMRGTTLGGERRIKLIQKVLRAFVSDKNVVSSLCQETLGLADQVEETIILREDSDLVMRPEMECKEASDLVLRPGMEGEMMNMVSRKNSNGLPSQNLPLMDELTYEPVEDFGPRTREGQLSAEDVDVFEGVQKYVPASLPKEEWI